MRTPQWAIERINKAKKTNITELDLSCDVNSQESQKLDAIPNDVFKLTQLTSLDLSNNKLANFPVEITKLNRLEALDLSGNNFVNLPDALFLLHKLRVLNLSYNQLGFISEAIKNLVNLEHLDVSWNQLKQLPISIAALDNLSELKLENNPLLISPPIEIATRGIKAIRVYFRQLNEEGVDYLYEAKLFILGEGGAGKTTFAHKILDSNYSLKDEGSTRGIDVLKWSFPIEGNKQFKVNIWNFGGQAIYHATHQFFLTKRALCSAPLKWDTEEKQDKLCSRRSARWHGQEETLVRSLKRRWC